MALVIKSKDFPEKEVLALKRGEVLVWIHPEHVRKYGPFVYRHSSNLQLKYAHSHPSIPLVRH